MDQIIKSIDGLSLVSSHREDLRILRQPANCINFQKILLPSSLMRDFNIDPGSHVFLLLQKTKLLLKAFEALPNVNSLEVYGIVECDMVIPNSEMKIQKVVTYKKFTSVTVDVICQNSHASKWLSKKEKLPSFLGKRILRNVIFCAKSIINYDYFPNSITMGILKVKVLSTNTDNVGFINSSTKINLRHVFAESMYVDYEASPTHFFGGDRIVQELTDIINFNIEYNKLQNKLLPPVKQVLLAGPSGCGKSSLIQKLCEDKNCLLIKIIGQDIHCKDPGQSERMLRDVFQEVFLFACSEVISILLLEDVDVICPRGNIAPHTSRLSAQLLHLLDKCQETPGVIVVATTNKPGNLKAGLRRHGRLAKEIFISKPNETDRAEIITKLLGIYAYHTDEECTIIGKEVATITPGYIGADLKLLCQTVCSKLNGEISEDKISCTLRLMNHVLLTMKPASRRSEVEVISAGMAPSLGGLDDVRKQLELSVYCSLLTPHVYTRMGIQKPRGILLYGPPGCAKTSLAKALAAKGNITVLYATNASIYSPYIGDAEKAVDNLFHNARQNTPAVIFIDEIDSLVGSRGASNSTNDVQERVLTALLTQMDGIGITKAVADEKEEWPDGDGVMVVAATNRPNEIDAALLRPGRFDRHIFVPPPDEPARLHILTVLAKDTPLHGDVDFSAVARNTRHYSGADLKNLHKEAVLYAMKEDGVDVDKIRHCHYEQALKVARPSLSEELIERFKSMFYVR